VQTDGKRPWNYLNVSGLQRHRHQKQNNSRGGGGGGGGVDGGVGGCPWINRMPTYSTSKMERWPCVHWPSCVVLTAPLEEG